MAKAKLTKITGNTYPVKDQLKALGGKWNAASKCWEVPADRAEQAWALVGGEPAVAKPAAPEEYVNAVVGEFRGQPVHLKGASGGYLFMTWGDKLHELPLEWVNDHARTPIEIFSAEESEPLRPMFMAMEARKAAAKAESERKEAADREAKAAERRAADRWPISDGEGYGGSPFRVGETFRTPKAEVGQGYPEFLTVLSASQRYHREDGFSFHVGAECGHVYSAVCRAATAEESRPILEREQAKANTKQAAKDLAAIAEQIRKAGERPEGRNLPDGEEVPAGGGDRIYGGGRWFVLGTDWIWLVQNNGHDGDDWSLNNVTTGGAGAIGWRIPADAGLAAQVRELASAAGYISGNKN
jgi:hypothetical protein